MNLFKKSFYFAKNKLFPDRLKQELLLMEALNLRGISFSKRDIEVNHDQGYNTIKGKRVNIIYPDNYIKKTLIQYNREPTVNFYFNGFMPASGGRFEMMEPFIDRSDALVIDSSEGRKRNSKVKFNNSYYEGLGSSRFGLCPHQLDWPGDKSNLWTYRFIECCFVGAIPIIFEQTPLGAEFTEGFHFFSDKEILECKLPENYYNESDASHNRSLALKRFILPESFK